MATPALTVNNISHSIVPGSPGSIRVNTFDSDGAVLDVSTGFTVGFAKAVPATDANPLATPVSILSSLTPAFDATGIDLAYTAAQSATIAAALATVRSSVGIGVSNDSSTTDTLAAICALTVRPDKQLT